ncbi:MAG: D-alanyl-D-alanine carboxypeptidase [Clostridia bacterium]|nr:D-alanyl-D-alanine carboxypeptidase [Clostridia bacterium]
MKKTLTAFLIGLLLVLNSTILYAVDEPKIDAQSYILIDAKTGQTLYEYNANQKLYPASTTKMMTGIIALERGDLNQLMTASQSAVNDIGNGGMNIGIMAGEQVRLEDLLNALLVRSANETANIIAENISPTRKDFVDLMNQKALDLGASNTKFVNPCGIDTDKANQDQYSTASDLAKIARYGLTLPKFREIISKTSCTVPPTNKHDKEVFLPTTNKLLLSRYKSEICTFSGVKTGYTDRAGSNLVSSAYNNHGAELIAVIMGVRASGNENVFSYSKKLLEYGFKNYSVHKIFNANEVVKTVQVKDGDKSTALNLVTASDFSALLPIDTNQWNIVKKETINSGINAPVKKGDVLGSIEYSRNGVSLGKVNVVAFQAVEKSIPPKPIESLKNTLKFPILKNIIIAMVLTVVVFFILRLTLRKISRSLHSKRQQNSE